MNKLILAVLTLSVLSACGGGGGGGANVSVASDAVVKTPPSRVVTIQPTE